MEGGGSALKGRWGRTDMTAVFEGVRAAPTAWDRRRSAVRATQRVGAVQAAAS